MDTGNLIGHIKNGSVDYKVGDKVICFRRNSRGHPRSIKDDVEYTIKSITYDDLFVATHSLDGIGWNQIIKVHKSYMISRKALRDIKINEILK
jgi:hypothetical protein